MRARSRGARSRTAGLEREHGLDLGHARGKLAEVCRILDGLHVEKNLTDVVLILPVFDGVFGIDVGLVADGDELRKADAEVLQNVENAAAQRARLRDEADVTAHRKRFGKAGVHAHVRMRVDPAQAVGPHAAHAVFLDAFVELSFHFGAFFDGLLKARRDHDEALDALFVALINRGKHKLGVNDDHGHVYGAFDVEHARIGLKPFDHAALGIDRVDAALKTELD